MEDQILKIVNARFITPKGIICNHQLICQAGKIVEITDNNHDIPNAVILDAQGQYVAPGCIDTHIHGGGGHDFTEATAEAFYSIAEAHARQGTTALYPTMAATSTDVFYKAIDTCEQIMYKPANGARIMGLHLEGNYLNPVMKGGQEERYLHLPNPIEYQALLNNTNCIKRWSASPELEGALEFARYATDKGVLVSLAHTTANYPLVRTAFDAGFRHATHFYNAMTGVHKERECKQEGTIEAIYLMDDMTVELVCDGIHVPSAILKLVYKVKGTEKIALITDAMYASAWPDAEKEFNDPRFILENGVCKFADRSALTGSLAAGIRMIQVMVQQAEIPLIDAVRMASETPARIMGIEHKKGSLATGKEADIIIFDENFQVKTTIVEGKIIFQQH
ncbi:N-acetylglucosamine-6-phosphate deacetylase [Parabacteroides sp. OttesenSCG-928-G07]|nr:N-acetylglucosamine-6-phosphate deacetylase [Parabacteroides sp. OttesenSCG-928-G07]